MRGGDPNNGQGLEEDVEGLMECGWHVFEYHPWYLVWSRNFMAWRSAKGLLEDDRCDLSDQHWYRGDGGWLDMAMPREWCARGECGARGESCRFQ